MVRYLLGIQEEERQRLRDELLETSQADFKSFADALDAARPASSVVVLGSSEAIQNSQLKQAGGLVVNKVM
jgi:Zn-dependent M16 (insulinase) family peptidase